MISETRLLTELSKVVKRARVDGISLCAHAKRRLVFRFAYEAVHQAIAQETVSVVVKVLHRHRVGVASADTLDVPRLLRCVEAATAIAAHAPKQEQPPALPSRHRLQTSEDASTATAGFTPSACVATLKHLVRICQGAGASLAGSFVTGEDAFVVVNSAGVACAARSTVSGAKLVTMYRKLSGYASGVHQDIRKLNVEDVLQRSLHQSLHQREPVTVPLGSYEVILEPDAVAELIGWLGYTAFGAKSVQERTSFMAGRIGERVVDPSITIYDDGTEPMSLRLPFDCEGTPKQRVVFIERGVAAGVAYDTTYGARFAHPSTGHGMPPDEVEGPLPLHLSMASGEGQVQAMIRSCRRGLLIPRFHYVNGLLNPREALMTGLTREGAFLIEHGVVTKPVATLRFTQSLLEALSDVRGISAERRLVADPSQELGCAVMPALHLGTFRFTGRSDR